MEAVLLIKCLMVIYLDMSMIKHPEGSNLLGEAGRDCESKGERLEEVIFALQKICHIQDKVHYLQHIGQEQYNLQ